MKHLYYKTKLAYEHGVIEDNPIKQMDILGISYFYAMPDITHEHWVFYDCTNIPEVIPCYIREVDADPMKFIGNGISKDKAEQISLHIINRT